MDAVGAGLGTGELEQGHRHHHHAHQDLGDIIDKCLQVAQQKALRHNHSAAQIQDSYRGAVHSQHHDRHDSDDLQPYVQSGLHQLIIGPFELSSLVVLPDKCLDHTDGHQVLLQGVVQPINFLLHRLKEPGTYLHQNSNGQYHQGDDHHQHDSQPGVNGNTDDQGGDEHHRSPDQHPQAHIQHHGHGVDIVGHPGNERSGRKSVDVSEGKLLYLVEQTLAQVSAKALAGEGGVFCRAHAAGHGEEGQQEHQTAHQKDVAHISGRDGHIHDLRHDQREDQLADDLQGNQDGGLDRVLLVPLQMGKKQRKQIKVPPLLGSLWGTPPASYGAFAGGRIATAPAPPGRSPGASAGTQFQRPFGSR